MIHASIAGAESAVAGELIRILLYHPDVEIIGIYSPTLAGKALDEVHHGMIGDSDLRFCSAIDFNKTNALFICTPQPDTFFAELPDDLRIIDLTDSHIASNDDFVYGICELNRKPLVRGAIHAALPSAIAQTALLTLLPLANNLLLNCDITVRASQPIAAADITQIETVVKTLQLSFNHQITTDTTALSGTDRAMFVEVSFDCAIDIAQVADMFNEFYDDHNFTFVIARKPDTADVANTNKCIINIARNTDKCIINTTRNTDGTANGNNIGNNSEANNSRIILTAAIDPRIKGTAGTAVHCMNLLFGLHERVGLTLKPSIA